MYYCFFPWLRFRKKNIEKNLNKTIQIKTRQKLISVSVSSTSRASNPLSILRHLRPEQQSHSFYLTFFPYHSPSLITFFLFLFPLILLVLVLVLAIVSFKFSTFSLFTTQDVCGFQDNLDYILYFMDQGHKVFLNFWAKN